MLALPPVPGSGENVIPSYILFLSTFTCSENILLSLEAFIRLPVPGTIRSHICPHICAETAAKTTFEGRQSAGRTRRFHPGLERLIIALNFTDDTSKNLQQNWNKTREGKLRIRIITGTLTYIEGQTGDGKTCFLQYGARRESDGRHLVYRRPPGIFIM